jgi:hypothetical protein
VIALAFLVPLVLAGIHTAGLVQVTIWSQKLGKRFPWYAKHEELHLLLMLYAFDLLFLVAAFFIGAALVIGATP